MYDHPQQMFTVPEYVLFSHYKCSNMQFKHANVWAGRERVSAADYGWLSGTLTWIHELWSSGSTRVHTIR